MFWWTSKVLIQEIYLPIARFKGKTGKNKKRRVFIFPKVLKTHLLNSNLKFRKKIEFGFNGLTDVRRVRFIGLTWQVR